MARRPVPAHLALTSLAVACGAAVSACDPQVDAPEPTTSLQLTASPARVPSDGTTVDLTVIAAEADGSPGQGSVVLRTPAGKLDGTGAEITLELAHGRAAATFSCALAEDRGCAAGKKRLSAAWKAAATSVSVEVYAVASPDGGTADAGDGRDAGDERDAGEPPDAGQAPDASRPADAGLDAGSLPWLALSASKTRIFSNVGDWADLTATLKTHPDGGVLAGEPIEFSTNLGGFTPSGTGTDITSTVHLDTQANGAAVARFMEQGTKGTALVSARHLASGQTAQVAVEIVGVQQITHLSTTCGGQACTIMGIKGSGFNEQAQVTFKVVDSSNRPAPGIAVTFSIDNPPAGTTVAPKGVADTLGLVTTNVSAGGVIGAFTVNAVVIPGQVEARSGTIGIRGALPANKGFSLKCSPVNVGAYVSPDPPASYKVACDVKVVDRYNNPVGTGTAVNFKVEAGSIPNSINTKKYEPAGSNTDEGTATVVFDTRGSWPAVEVAPLDALPGQWPYAREAEPRIQDGALTRNPRDGLITVLAYVRGEEFFQDNNSNGAWDPGESFIDQGEPFVDSNDNGQWDPGEVSIDEAPLDNKWNPPNGKWDNTTTIWVEARILVTSRPVPHSDYSYIVPNPWGPVAKAGFEVLHAWFADLNLNRPQAQGTSFSAAFSGSPGKGSVKWDTGGLLDGYGFGIERRLISADDGRDCTAATPLCNWKVLFKDWGRGYCGAAIVTGAAASDTKPAVQATVLIDATVLSGTVTIGASGVLE